MGLLERLEQARIVRAAQEKDVEPENIEYYDEYEDFKDRIHMELVKRANTPAAGDEKAADIRTVISQLVEAGGEDIPRSKKQKLVQQIYDEAQGLGPLEKLLRDDTISEVMVNGPYNVYVERRGRLELTDIKLKDDRYVLELIGKIAGPLGRRCDESSPMLDARLPDGSRVNAIIPPLSLKGPSITIRKFSKIPLRADNLIDFGSASFQMLQFLEACVKARANVIVCGGTGSGKTTLLNILSAYIPEDERIVTIEDSAELQLSQRHTITLESRPSNAEGKGEITIRDLVRNALRMRPDRIIVGECRSGETLDMLQAMNTGHDGSISTGHGNSPKDMITRLETMVLMAADLPLAAVRNQIASAVDLMVHVGRLRDKSRKVLEISEVTGCEEGQVILEPVFTFREREGKDRRRVEGTLEKVGELRRREKLRAAGLDK